jgi:hypothetical protein
MKITIKFFMVILFLVSSLILAYGCGKSLNGHTSGGCPDSVAPDGATITTPSLNAPFVNSTSCYPTVGFTVKDSDGNPMNNICVEIFSDANIALHSGAPDCSNAAANPQSSMITRTDNSGNVVVELLTGPTPTGKTHFVQVTSGALTGIATTAGAQ